MKLVAEHRSRRSRRLGPALILAAIIAALTMAIAAPAQASPNLAKAWGQNSLGQLGTGSNTGPETCQFFNDPCSKTPVAVSGLSGITAVAAGSQHSLALLANGTVMAWGEDRLGQLGDGEHHEFSAVPVAVCGVGATAPCSATNGNLLSGVTAVAAGRHHSLALLSNGTVVSWGSNESGALGTGKFESSNVPVAVSGLSGVTAVSAGGEHSLALLSNGTVMAWGDGSEGELGNGKSGFGYSSNVPVEVSGLTRVTAVAAGGLFSLALLKNGTVMAWGQNFGGQLGSGTTKNKSSVPVEVIGLTGVTGIAAGGRHSLALLGNGTVMAWGRNNEGQLGNGTTTPPEGSGLEPVVSPPPTAVTGLTGVTAVSAGDLYSLALLGNGTVMAWGQNLVGELGNGTETNSNVPVEVSGLTGVTAVSAGEYADGFGAHSLALVPPPPPPSVTAISPKEGSAAGGTSVSITGTNLAGATAVKFGSTNATSFKVNSATSITAVSPAGTGTVHVTVTTPGGTSATSSADQFTYGPTVSKVEPNHGSPSGGTTVTITGTGFTGATAVKFGSTNAASFKVNSATSITAVSPNKGMGTGTVDVTVTTPAGTSPTSSADRFTYKK